MRASPSLASILTVASVNADAGIRDVVGIPVVTSTFAVLVNLAVAFGHVDIGIHAIACAHAAAGVPALATFNTVTGTPHAAGNLLLLAVFSFAPLLIPCQTGICWRFFC